MGSLQHSTVLHTNDFKQDYMYSLTFDRFSFSPINNVTQAYNSLLIQALVRKFMGTGFYFGPQIGAYMGSVSVLGTTTTFNGFAVGAVGGYDYDFNQSLSAGLEFNYQSLNGGTANGTKFDGTYALKGLVDVSYHFNTDRTIATTPSSAYNSNAPENESTYFAGIFGGASYAEANLQGASGDTKINYGARFGMNSFKLPSFGTIAFAVQADRFTPAFATGTTAYVHTFMAQILARRLGDSGYYLGVEGGLGMSHFSTPAGSTTFNDFVLGGLAGYDYYLTQNWSIAPEFRFDHYMQSHSGNAILTASSVYRYLANISYHF